MSNSYSMHKYRKKEVLTAVAFLLPVAILFAVFKYYPLLDNFRISLTNWNFFRPEKTYVGLDNFINILSSKDFWSILGNTFFYTICSTLISIVIGFFLAISLFRMRGHLPRVLKTLFFVPNVTTASAMAILWMWIFDPDFGLSGQLFALFGKESPRWLLTPGLAMWVIISLAVWRSMGYVMLIYTSGLSGIGDEIYEAARIDGASQWQQTVRITIPMLRSTSFFLMLTMFIQAMQVFDIVSVMTGGGPYDSTNVLNLYIYQMAFGRSRAGYAAALSVILFLILLLCTVIQQVISRKKEDEDA